MNDDIVAVATAHGTGGISIVRLSGAKSLNLALNLINKNSLKPRYATLCEIKNTNGEFIDEAIVIYFKTPFSFTGEEVVEFHTHGGLVISNLIIDELVNLGARIASQGEFSKRAYLNGKMDLTKAEAIQALINSRSESATKILAKNLHGELKNYVETLRSELVKTLAFVETCIDYAEEDLPSDILEKTSAMLDENSAKLSKIAEVSEQRKGLIEGFKVAIIGKPNVGKSSILNSLLNYERAIVSDEAGTTRDRIEESLKIGTHIIRIIDTAGIRNGASNLENIGISHSIKAVKEADIILAVFDGSSEFDGEDDKILEILKDEDKKVFYIINKSDLEQKFSKNLPNSIKISAKFGTDELINSLNEYLNSQNFDGLMLSSNRQIIACKNAVNAIQRAKEKLNESELEIFAFELNVAIKEISSISRPFDRDEILDEMFSNFCLGK